MNTPQAIRDSMCAACEKCQKAGQDCQLKLEAEVKTLKEEMENSVMEIGQDAAMTKTLLTQAGAENEQLRKAFQDPGCQDVMNLRQERDEWKQTAIEGKGLKDLFKARAEKAEAKLAAARPEVRAFAQLMEDRLAANEHKGGWKGCSVGWLFSRLQEEARELEHELDTRQYIWVDKEAADVANFAMMIVDVCGRLAYREKAEKAGEKGEGK